MQPPTLDRLVDNPAATLTDLRTYTKENGGRTRLRWVRNFGAVQRDDGLVICATDPNDIRTLLAVADRLWGANANDGKRQF
ncbi:MAG: hypothetical protein V4510_11800 [bacterium]